MNRVAVFFAGVIVALLVAAVAVIGIHPATKKPKQILSCDDDATPRACSIDVTVEPCGLLNLGHCTTVVNDAVKILNKKDIELYWILKDQGYKFATDSNGNSIGIVVTNGGNAIVNCSGDDRTFSCKNKHKSTGFGVYKYTVNVSTLDPLDPWIVND